MAPILHFAYLAFWNGLAFVTLFASFLFCVYTGVAAAVLFAGMADKSLCLKDRFILTILMGIVVFWGAWLTHFSYIWGWSFLTA